MIHVGRDNEIILVRHQLQKVIVDRFGGIHIAVDIDVSAPIAPMLLRHGKGIKAAGIHILDAVLCRKVGKVFFKPFAGVNKSG